MKKIKTIYEYFSEYTKEDIDAVLAMLTEEEKELITLRYGDDLESPQTSEYWTIADSKKFYGTLIDKIKKILAKKLADEKRQKNYERMREEELMSSLFSLLREEYSNSELCEKLNINSQQLCKLLTDLKNKGIAYATKYYYDGSIKYGNITKLPAFNKYNINPFKEIIMNGNENSLKLLLISDLHLGNELERIDLVNRAFNYCIKNGINIILCGGDFIDGSFGKGNKTIPDLYQQIEYFLKNYPYDKNILTFGVAGDHDLCVLNKLSLDFIEICKNSRPDIVIGGYSNSVINIKNDKIHLFHRISYYGVPYRFDAVKAPIVLHGHYHKFVANMANNALHICIPSICEIRNMMPSALELNICFEKGYIVNSVIKHLYFGTQDIVLSELRLMLSKERNFSNAEDLNAIDINETSDDNKVLEKSINCDCK